MLSKPTEAQIQQTIQDLQDRLQEPPFSKPINRAIKEGLTESLNILAEGRLTYNRIDKLSTVQARAIAILAVDYLNGEIEKHVLLGVPLSGLTDEM